MYSELGPARPSLVSGRAASGPWDSTAPTTLSSHAKGPADYRKITARHTAAPQCCPAVAMELWWAAAELAATGRSCHWEMHREAGRLPLTPAAPVSSFSFPAHPVSGKAGPKFPSLPRVELPKVPCHARSQRTGSRNPTLEGHDAKDEDKELQHNVSRTRKGGLTLHSPQPHTLLSLEGTVGWSSG